MTGYRKTVRKSDCVLLLRRMKAGCSIFRRFRKLDVTSVTLLLLVPKNTEPGYKRRCRMGESSY